MQQLLCHLDSSPWTSSHLACKQYGARTQKSSGQNCSLSWETGGKGPSFLAISAPLLSQILHLQVFWFVRAETTFPSTIVKKPLNSIVTMGFSLSSNFSRFLISCFSLSFSTWIEAEFSVSNASLTGLEEWGLFALSLFYRMISSDLHLATSLRGTIWVALSVLHPGWSPAESGCIALWCHPLPSNPYL